MHYATGFISDVHIGSLVTEASALNRFLAENTFNKLYLVGDIFDFWKSFHVSSESKKVVEKLLALSEQIPVIYIPGNHDSWFRDFEKDTMEKILILKDDIHVGSDGRRWYVTHGDQFDSAIVTSGSLISKLGGWVYDFSLMLRSFTDSIRAMFGMKKSSFNTNITNLVRSLKKFETAACNAAKSKDCCGVVCGHTHTKALHSLELDGSTVHYVNTGDWVISCTAAVENLDGTIEIVSFKD